MSRRLEAESSPYLRQHADQPVDWYPWGAEAFAVAARLDRPLLISIGYSACHWCHVMARESFADPETAEILNRLFINVKVDREERPDIDALYLDATQALTGSGGWPMTVFAFPDGRPFFAGTYFPRSPRGDASVTFLEICFGVDQLWRTQRAELEDQANEVTAALRERAAMSPTGVGPSLHTVDRAVQGLLDSLDEVAGGFGRAPKFPQPNSVDLLVRAWRRTGDPAVAQAVTLTLDALGSGGVFDHLGGGFARYAVDRHWQVPHFEKLLGDQAMVTRCYLHAHQVSGLARYRQVVADTVHYVESVLSLPDGGFATSEDAESEGVEGRYWTWDATEFAETLATGGLDPMEQMAATLWWGVTPEGNFPGHPGRNVLHRAQRGDLVRPPVIERARRLLMARRQQRPSPQRNDTVITEWNALWVATLAEAAWALDQGRWAERAVRGGRFLLGNLRTDHGRWMRTWRPGDGARHLACAADYAALIDAFSRLGELTGDPQWVDEARTTADAMLDLFWDEANGGLFTTGADTPTLVTRSKDLADNSLPSANGAAAVVLARLAARTGNTSYLQRSREICQLVGSVAEHHPTGFTHLLGAVELIDSGIVEVVITGNRPDLVREVASAFRPGVVIAWGTPDAGPLWEGRCEDDPGRGYVCQRGACALPVDEPTALGEQLAARGCGLPAAAVDNVLH